VSTSGVVVLGAYAYNGRQRRVVAKRSYKCRVTSPPNDPFTIALSATDGATHCLTDARLPPQYSGPPLRAGVAVGHGCVHLSTRDGAEVSYVGGLLGHGNLGGGPGVRPFNRAGKGSLYVPPRSGFGRSPSKGTEASSISKGAPRGQCILDGLWSSDVQVRPAILRDVSSGEIINTAAVECKSGCGAVISKSSLRRHTCAPRGGIDPYKVTQEYRNASVVNGASAWESVDKADIDQILERVRSKRAPKPALPPVRQSYATILADRVDGEFWAYVPQNLKVDTLQPGRGERGYCLVRCNVSDVMRSKCFGVNCRLASNARGNPDCRHLKFALAMWNDGHRAQEGSEGLSMTGFLGHVVNGDKMDLRECVLCERLTFMEAGASNVHEEEEGGSSSDEGGSESDSDSDDSDLETCSVCKISDEWKATLPPSKRTLMAFVQPTVEAVLQAGREQLTQWCHAYGLRNCARRKPSMQSALLARLLASDANATAPTTKPHHRAVEDGPSTLERLRAHAKSMRCSDGKLCHLHMLEYEQGQLRRSAIVAANEDGTGDHQDTRVSSAVLAMSRSSVDDVLYSQLLAYQRGGSPVTRLGGGAYAVLRCRDGEGDYASPGGYSLVKLATNVDDVTGRITNLVPTCSCSSFRAASKKLGGSSLQGGAKSCICFLMVILAECAAADPSVAVETAGAYLTAALQVEGRSVDGRNSVKEERQAQLDVLVSQYEAGPRFPAVLPNEFRLAVEWARSYVQQDEVAALAAANATGSTDAMAALQAARQEIHRCMSGTTFARYPHIFPQQILPLECLAGDYVCCSCPVDAQSRCAPPPAMA
jgi:hypothetical protein